jgi:hypothetical protein
MAALADPSPIGRGLERTITPVIVLARKGEGLSCVPVKGKPLTLSASRIATLSEPQALSLWEREVYAAAFTPAKLP